MILSNSRCGCLQVKRTEEGTAGHTATASDNIHRPRLNKQCLVDIVNKHLQG